MREADASFLQCRRQRQDLLLEYRRGDRPDLFVADYAFCVDEVGLGNAVDAIVDADAPVGVDHREFIRVAELLQPRRGLVALVLVVQTEYRHHTAFGECQQHGMLFAAGHAPGRPDVEQPDLAAHVPRHEALVRLLQDRQLERWSRLANQRRGNLARIQFQSYREKADQENEDPERQQEALHAVLLRTTVASGASAASRWRAAR